MARHTYAVSPTRPVEALQRVLADYRFDIPYAHQLRCAAAIAVRLQDDLAHWGDTPVRSIELLDTVFYRERRAYLVGRVFGEHRFSPCVIALVNDERGLRADAVLTRRRDVAHLFGVSRSYFQANLATVGDAVVFLRSLLPGKPIDEIYTVLGRAKQGKTERYRTFFRHFNEHPQERLVHAEGTPGMVMAVFTLPSYPLVFKLIRDRFAWPKAMSRQQVEEKYALVFNLDRVGRLLDAQPYRHLRFPRERFAPALLDELLQQCAQSVRIDGDEVEVALCYVQRRFRPLNLYLREQGGEAVRAAVLDYAQAITDMARNNIFPGACCRRISAYHGMAGQYSTTTTSCAWSATACSAPGRSRVRRRKRCPTSHGSMSVRATCFPSASARSWACPLQSWQRSASTTGTCSTRAGGRACRSASPAVTIRIHRPMLARTGWREPAVMGVGTEVLSPFITKDPAIMRSPCFSLSRWPSVPALRCSPAMPARRPRARFVPLRR